MGVKKSVGRDQARGRSVPNASRFPCGVSRASLLASVSLVASVVLAAPDRALAKCSGANQTFSTATTGPVFSDGGALTVTKSGSVTGASGLTGLDGVDAVKCRVTTLGNSGAIAGGAGNGTFVSGFGGAAVSNAGTIRILTNTGAINGGEANTTFGHLVAGGDGILNSAGAP
jgi:hypothetical protein